MEIIRSLDGNINIKDGKKMILESESKGGNLKVTLSKEHQIIISKNDDMYLYENIKKIINNKYTFDDSGLSYQVDNKIIFMSDEYKYNKGSMNRIILEDLGDKIKLSAENASNKNENLKIYFFPVGGAYSVNSESKKSFQEDMVESWNKTMQYKLFTNNKKGKIYRYI